MYRGSQARSALVFGPLCLVVQGFEDMDETFLRNVSRLGSKFRGTELGGAHGGVAGEDEEEEVSAAAACLWDGPKRTSGVPRDLSKASSLDRVYRELLVVSPLHPCIRRRATGS